MLGAPNIDATQSLPLGNGSLGAAVWDKGGFTAQLNRADTMPDRKSPGQVTIPGLSHLTGAKDFTAHLDLYDATLTETGGGMTAKTFVRADRDELVVDVSGADPNSTQTVQGSLWAGRSPHAEASGAIGSLAETWQDTGIGGSGQTFGTLLAVTAGGRNVASSVASSQSVKVSFNPDSDGSFRVVVAAPRWQGGDQVSTAAQLLGADASTPSSTLQAAHLDTWRKFWARADLLEMSSADGSAQYLENLRTLYLYQENSLNQGAYPGTQAGVADLFAFSKDTQDWVPSDSWHWNQRMQIAANSSSGVPSLNTPFFNLYISNLANLEVWTSSHMPGTTGVCVPETMRYNGNGYYGHDGTNASCDTTIAASYNSQTITSGAEISLQMWSQYLNTRDIAFLQKAYPLMKASAQFLLSYATPGSDGVLHTQANAHETQWAVQDPATDIAAMQALFPAVASAAQTLGTDASFVSQLMAAQKQIPPLPRTDAATHQQVLTPSADPGGQDVLADSAQPTAPFHNGENVDLESVYPYGLVGTDSGAMTTLAQRTYAHRLFQNNADWDYDALDAARLGLADEVASDLTANVKKYQSYVSGLASLGGSVGDEPYDEESGIVADALNEALVQDYSGVLHVAPAWPAAWDASGSVSIQNNSTVDVQISGGVLSTVVLEAGAAASFPVANPWPGSSVQVVDAASGSVAVPPTTAEQFSIAAASGHAYLIERTSTPSTALPVAQVTGSPASAAKHLGNAQIGLDPITIMPNLASTFDNVAVTQDTNTAPGNIDGGGASMSAQALDSVGLAAGKQITHAAVTLTWPSSAGTGKDDNTVANGQTIALSGSGQNLGFLATSTYGPTNGTGTVTYTDGSTQMYGFGTPDWFGGNGDVVATAPYQNRTGNTQFQGAADVFFVGVPLQQGKTVATVQLPHISSQATAGTPALHVFAMNIDALAPTPDGPDSGGGTTPGTGGVDVSAWYELVNGGSGACVDDVNSSMANGNPVQQWTCTGATNQQWRFRTANDGYYEVQNRHAASVNEAFDVTGTTTATQPGAKLQTWQYGGATNQQFKPVPVADGSYRLIARHSGLCLEVPDNSTANGIQLQQNTCNGTAGQTFNLVTQP